MAGESEVLNALLELLDDEAYSAIEIELRSEWRSAGLPAVADEEVTGREQIAVAAQVLRRLATQARSLTLLVEQHPETGIRFRNSGDPDRSPDDRVIPERFTRQNGNFAGWANRLENAATSLENFNGDGGQLDVNGS